MKVDKKIILPSIFILVVSVFVISLAYFGAEVIENGNNPTGVTTGNLDVSLSDSAVSVSNLKPIYAQYIDSMAYKKEFTITNAEDSLDSSNDIYLSINNISNELKNQYFKYKVVVDKSEKSGDFSGAVNGEKLLIYNDLGVKSNTSKTISLYIWIEYAEGVDQLDMLGTELSANLWLESIDKKIPPTIYEKILANNPTIKNDNASLFENVADEESESGLFRTTLLDRNEDIDGDGVGEEVLYFRGVVENNYLVFANQCWRIVRTNESGNSIKLRYGGKPTISGDTYTCPQTGTDVKITVNNRGTHTFSYNGQYNNAKYVKWVHEDGMDSNAKTQVETWYTNEIETQGEAITNLIIDEPYCNDTSVGRTSGSSTYYGAYIRLYTNKSPQFKCPNASDKYTVDATKGNGKLSKPIGLLTADEVVFAGGKIASGNSSYYLYTGGYYWTLSPYRWTSSGAVEFNVYSSGGLDSNRVYNAVGLLPSVSIKVNAVVRNEGTGEYNNPYIILTQ